MGGWGGKGRHASVPSLNPCSPVPVSTHRYPHRYPPEASGNERERKRNVWRGRNSRLRLRRRRVGVCLRVSGGCRGDAKARGARVQFVFVSVIACCSGYRRRGVHYADSSISTPPRPPPSTSTPKIISPYPPCRLTSPSASGCALWSRWGALGGCERGCCECVRGGSKKR